MSSEMWWAGGETGRGWRRRWRSGWRLWCFAGEKWWAKAGAKVAAATEGAVEEVETSVGRARSVEVAEGEAEAADRTS